MTSSDHRQSAVERELAIEQEHVDRVYAQLEIAEQSARAAHQAGSNIFKTDRADFLREENGTALFERDAFTYQAAKRLAILNAEHEGLVFGRLDMDPVETRYIGRIGVRDDDYEPLVMDWRAPAAEPFYRATATNPMGVVRRRVLRCRDDKVIGIEDDLLDAEAESDLVVIGEGALMASLRRARGHTMRDIVATIQSEQDEAIRAPYQGVTIISGGPGTGKTVVALHRAAYLLYTYRAHFERGGVMVVGPSSVFMNYIERVLPGLGEDSVTLKAIGHVASDVLDFSSDRLDPAPTAALKGSLKLLPLLRRLVQAPAVAAEQSEPLMVTVKGEVLTLDSVELAALRRGVLSGHLANQARYLAETALVNALWDKLPDDISIERDAFDDLVTSQASFVRFMAAWWPPLAPTDLLASLADPEIVANVNQGTLSDDEVQMLTDSYRPIADQLVHDVKPAKLGWTAADIALLDELAALLGPVEKESEVDTVSFLDEDSEVRELVTMQERLTSLRSDELAGRPQDTFAHILVDEAQDVTPMQWRMLRRRGPQASWTLVGDLAQSSYPDADEVTHSLRDLVGSAPRRDFRLSKNYRSPKEVFDVAAQVITSAFPDADLPEAIRTTGVAPEFFVAPADQARHRVLQLASDLAQQVEGTVGLVCPPSLIEDATQALQEADFAPDVRDRIIAVTALQAKGLEYDGVIVVSPDDIVAEITNGIRALYVALTRPTQRLVTLDIGDGPGTWRHLLDAFGE